MAKRSWHRPSAHGPFFVRRDRLRMQLDRAVKAQSYQQPTLALSTDLSATSRLSSIHPRACEMLYVAELGLGTIRAIARLTEESVPIILK